MLGGGRIEVNLSEAHWLYLIYWVCFCKSQYGRLSGVLPLNVVVFRNQQTKQALSESEGAQCMHEANCFQNLPGPSSKFVWSMSTSCVHISERNSSKSLDSRPETACFLMLWLWILVWLNFTRISLVHTDICWCVGIFFLFEKKQGVLTSTLTAYLTLMQP